MVAGHGSSGEQVRCIRPHRILLGPLSNHDSRYSRRPPPVYAGGWAVSRGRWGLCYSSLVPKGPRSSGDRAPPSGGGCGRSNRPGGTALGQHKRPDLGPGVVVRGMVCGMGLAIVPHMPRRRRRARGHIEELPSGSFRAVVYAGIDPLTGKSRYLRETAKTYDAAEVVLTKLQGHVDEDRHPKTAITVRQAIAQWLEVAKLEDTTRERYDDLIRLYILPTFGEMQAGAGCAPAPRPTAAVGVVVLQPEHEPAQMPARRPQSTPVAAHHWKNSASEVAYACVVPSAKSRPSRAVSRNPSAASTVRYRSSTTVQYATPDGSHSGNDRYRVDMPALSPHQQKGRPRRSPSCYRCTQEPTSWPCLTRTGSAAFARPVPKTSNGAFDESRKDLPCRWARRSDGRLLTATELMPVRRHPSSPTVWNSTLAPQNRSISVIAFLIRSIVSAGIGLPSSHVGAAGR